MLNVHNSIESEPLGFKICTELDRHAILCELNAIQGSVGATLKKVASSELLAFSVAPIPSDEQEAANFPHHWTEVSRIDAHIETHPIDSRILVALSLESHANMWSWFSEQVTKPAWTVANIDMWSLVKKPLPPMPNRWIANLVLSVRQQLATNSPTIVLKVKKFFPELELPDYTAGACTYGKPEKVVSHAEAAIILWLGFRPRPGMTLPASRAAASLLSVMLEAFGSPNFLYLNYIQHGIKKLRAILTDERVKLADVPWERLAEELKRHPLACPDSDETIALNRLKDLLWAISSFPVSRPSQMSELYEAAKELGGDEGVHAFMEATAPPPPET